MLFVKSVKKLGHSKGRTGGAWVTKPSMEKGQKKMREHSKSEQHRHACLAAHQVQTPGSIITQFQATSQSERQKTGTAIKSLIRCTHFLARNHIAHTTNFDKLVDLVVACGGESLKTYLETAGKKAQYTSKVAVVEFLDAIGTWVEETLLKRLCQAPYYSIMADECTDVSTIEELSIYCRWIENGEATEHYIEIVPLKNAGAEIFNFLALTF